MLVVTAANLIGKSIPSAATGPLGVLRKVLLVIGAYVPQRITPGVTSKTVAEAVTATLPDRILKEASNVLPSAVRTGTDAGQVARAIVDVARGLEPGRGYTEGESPAPDSIVPDEYRTDGPFQKQKGK